MKTLLKITLALFLLAVIIEVIKIVVLLAVLAGIGYGAFVAVRWLRGKRERDRVARLARHAATQARIAELEAEADAYRASHGG